MQNRSFRGFCRPAGGKGRAVEGDQEFLKKKRRLRGARQPLNDSTAKRRSRRRAADGVSICNLRIRVLSLKKMTECSQRPNTVANNLGSRQHWHRQNRSRNPPHPEPEHERDDDEDRIEGKSSGQKHRR